MMGLEAKSISVRFREGEILDENLVRDQVRESSGWQAVTVSPSRKTVDLGPHEFKAKSVGWKLSSEGRGTISGGNYEGFSESSSSDPEIKLNLTTPWVFFVQKEALSDVESGATGTLLYIRNSDMSAEKRVEDVEKIFYEFSSFEPSKGVKQDVQVTEDESDNKPASTKKKCVFGRRSKKKQKNVPPTPEPDQPVSDDSGW
jgi:hypothetical protein